MGLMTAPSGQVQEVAEVAVVPTRLRVAHTALKGPHDGRPRVLKDREPNMGLTEAEVQGAPRKPRVPQS
eukprot:6642980-Pyramimonas_sp.AAC.1